ncbi:MAG: hypothetical protein ACRDTU_05815 [Micromonosporaceae bacterium]
MQYLGSVIDDKTGSATPEEMNAINAFNDRLQADGRGIEALQPEGRGAAVPMTTPANRSGSLHDLAGTPR